MAIEGADLAVASAARLLLQAALDIRILDPGEKRDRAEAHKRAVKAIGYAQHLERLLK